MHTYLNSISNLDALLGALNEYALTALIDAEFRRLDLGPTMSAVNELDFPQGDIMRGTILTSFSRIP